MKEKIAIVTGASRGIGRETAILLAKNGYKVCVNYHKNETAANDVVNSIKSIGGVAIAIQANVANESEIIAMFQRVDSELGLVTALINSAGILAPKASIESLDSLRIERILATNVIGTMICCREAVKRMAYKYNGGGGSIVNLSSIAALKGSPNEFIDYAVSKGAIDTLTIGLAQEVASAGIRVNAVRPGIIKTEMHNDTGDMDRLKNLSPTIPIGRVGEALEVAEAIYWLVSDKSSYTTGSFINVAGGR